MMKKGLAMVLTMLLACSLLTAMAEPFPLMDGWVYVGLTDAGITFAIPDDCMDYLTEKNAANGVLLLMGNADCSIQLRRYEESQMTYEMIRELFVEEETSEVAFRMDGDREIMTFRNTTPTANSELFGIVLSGNDGMLYKVSIFTGMTEEFEPEARVWEIADTIAESMGYMDFSDWPIQEDGGV